jgi:hypothetical protein
MYIYICIYIIPTYIHTYIHMHLLLEHVFHLLQKERITQSQYVDKNSKYVEQIVENVSLSDFGISGLFLSFCTSTVTPKRTRFPQSAISQYTDKVISL